MDNRKSIFPRTGSVVEQDSSLAWGNIITEQLTVLTLQNVLTENSDQENLVI